MNSTTAPYLLSLLVLVGAACLTLRWYQVKQIEESQSSGGFEYTGPPLEEFEMTERSGEPFRSADMHGKVWCISFFFSTCPGACPRLNSSIRYLNSLEELDDVTWVSITVDPVTDTLPVLQKYAEQYGADPERWLFVRADLDYVKRVGRDMLSLDVTWRGHKDYAVVIDRTGKLRGMYDATSTAQSKKLRALLLQCLAEEAATEQPPAEPQPAETESPAAEPQLQAAG